MLIPFCHIVVHLYQTVISLKSILDYLTSRLDHIVYSVFDLEAAMDHFENKLGFRPVFGGHHFTRGTKNALLYLGDSFYLELLAVDTQNTQIKPPRWMGVDFLTSPKITRWAVNSTDLVQDSMVLKKANPKMGDIQEGSRALANNTVLKWQLSMPLPEPEVELLPFLIDWRASAQHPSSTLEKRCSLVEFSATHPQPEQVRTTLESLGLPLSIDKGEEIRIWAVIKGPKGSITL